MWRRRATSHGPAVRRRSAARCPRGTWTHNCPVLVAGLAAMQSGSVVGVARSAPGSAERAVEAVGAAVIEAAPVAAAAAARPAAVETPAAVAARRTDRKSVV